MPMIQHDSPVNFEKNAFMKTAQSVTFAIFLIPSNVLYTNSIPGTSQVPVAQWIARWPSNPKVLGSTPRWDDNFFHFLVSQPVIWKPKSSRQT